MKIFYAVQATGNGHISRAMELLPHLQKYSIVDIFLSGDNSHLELDAPVRYRSKGISLFYNCKGGLDYLKMWKEFRPLRVMQEIRDLPVDKYDLVLNDFDFITSAACARKKIPSVHFGHQASFQSPLTPRPLEKNISGEWLLKNYVRAKHHVGLHFKSYDSFILPAIVKKEIIEAEPKDNGYITVYLPSYCEKQLTDILGKLIDCRFQVFSKESKYIRAEGNITFMPVNKELFNNSLVNCTGIISGGGFETPAEALHLGKKIMVIPIRGQYEQQCNAEALRRMGVATLNRIDKNFTDHFFKWIETPAQCSINYSSSISKCMEYLMSLAESQHHKKAA